MMRRTLRTERSVRVWCVLGVVGVRAERENVAERKMERAVLRSPVDWAMRPVRYVIKIVIWEAWDGGRETARSVSWESSERAAG